MITTLVYKDGKQLSQNPPAENLAALRAEPGIMLWVDLSDPTAEETKLILETTFQFHPLTIEDCVADSPFPKLEDYEDYLYIVMHAVDYTRDDHFTTTELDLFLGKNFLVTFHRKPLKPVQASLDRYLRQHANTVVRGPDRFAHHLLDYMVEAYKPAMELLQAELDEVEAASLSHKAAKELFPQVASLRKEFAALRRIVRPQREVAMELAQGKTKLIRPAILPYLRDLAEELVRIEVQAESWAEELILSFRVYLNKSTHEANAGIKVLTAITALTIPVLSLGAWFGMNFKNMPELELLWTYPIATLLMVGGTVGMLWVMWRKKWI